MKLRCLLILCLLLAPGLRPACGGTDEDEKNQQQAEDAVQAEREKLKLELLEGRYQVEATDPKLIARIPEFIAQLDHPDYDARATATERIFECGDEAADEIEAALQATDLSAESRWRLEWLRRRIRWHLSAPLLERITDLFDNFETQEPLARRRLVYQLEHVAGELAVDTMIAVFERDPNDKVRQAALDATVRLKVAPNFEKIQNLFATGLQDLRAEEYLQAETAFLDVLKLDGTNAAAAYNLACIFAMQDKVQEAVAWLRKAVDLGFNNLTHIMEDKDLENIHGRGEFDDFMKEAFGDTYRSDYVPSENSAEEN